MVMAIAAEHNMGILQLHLQTAYLQSPVEKDVHVKSAPGYGSQGKVMKSNKIAFIWPTSIRQKIWFSPFDHSLADIGFVPTRSAPCVHVYRSKDRTVMLLL